MTVGAFIVARLSSSRLPAKNIMPILGRPMIELMIERIREADTIDKVIIATSSLPTDDPLEEVAKRQNVGCFRGSLDNVMSRVCGAAGAYDCDQIVEVLGDNPLIHGELIDDVVTLHVNGDYDYSATVTKEYPVSRQNLRLFSVGLRVQVYASSAAQAFKDYPEYISNDSKHPCAYIFEHPDRFRIGYLEAREKWAFMNRPDLNFAVNYRKNFDFVRTMFEVHYPSEQNFSLKRVYDYMDKHPYLYLLMGAE